MTKRNLLKQELIETWKQTIDGPYKKMLINSERGLAVHFVRILMEVFRDHKVSRDIYIEPTLVLEQGNTRIPDLVICDSKQVIGIVELKYAPRGLPQYEKDLETLRLIQEKLDDLKLSNERYRGPSEIKPLPFAKDLVLCWAAVHKDKPFPDRRHLEIQKLGGNYLDLRAAASTSGTTAFVDDKEVPEC